MHKVFVYGSLKEGFHNAKRLGDSEFVGRGVTVDSAFEMIDLDYYPGVVRTADEPVAIHGEVYSVTDDVLADLDYLEQHPGYYRREPVEITGHGPCWMYLLNTDRHEIDGPRVESGCWELSNVPV